MAGEIARRLWSDTSIFAERAQRDAAAWAALASVVSRRRPLDGGEGEFLGLTGFVGGLDPAVRADVAADPYARFWIRLAFALCGAAIRGEDLPRVAEPLADELGIRDPRGLLARHLDEYKRLALGAALRAGEKLEFAAPLEVALPMPIPVAASSLVGEACVARIVGTWDGAVVCEDPTVHAEPCPVVRVDRFELPLQPNGWGIPGMGWMPSAGRTTLAYQADQVPLVEGGLALVARHQPDVFEQIRRVMRWIAVNPMAEYDATNYVSFSELPGSFAFRGVPNPYSAAEACIHEFHHNRLFCLEEFEPVLEGEDLGTDDDARFYSPWREGPRPLRGVFHAVYVTVAQVRFWIDVLRRGDADESVLGFATDQLIRHPLMLELGLLQLERFAHFTTAGRAFFDEIVREIERLRTRIHALGVPRDTEMLGIANDGTVQPMPRPAGAPPVRIRASIVEHVREFDRGRQIPEAVLQTLAS